VALAFLMLGSAALILWLGRGLTFFRDEWIFVLYRDGHDPVNFLSSHAGHFSLWPIFFFLTLFKGIGLDHYEIYRAAAIPMHLLCALLLYLIARRRVGDVMALAPAAILLFLGSSWMDILWPFQVGFTGAIAFGLGAILALERDDLRGDVAACLLLLVAIGWSGAALPFIPGVAVGLFIRKRMWRRAWVFAMPAAAYLGWAAKYGEQGVDYMGNLPHVPEYVAREVGAGLSGVTALSGIRGLSQSLTLILVCVVLLAVLIRLVRLRRSSPLGWEALAMGLAFWMLTALARAQDGDPMANRYIYPSVVFLLLLAVGLAPNLAESGITVRSPRYYWACGVVLAIAIAVAAFNISDFQAGRKDLRFTSNVTSAELGALELARSTVAPRYSPPLNDFFGVPSAAYFAATDRYGSSPADNPNEIASSPEYARRRADRVSLQALRVRLRPVPNGIRLADRPMPVPGTPRLSVRRSGRCLLLRGRGLSPGAVLPRSGLVIRGPGSSEAAISLKRFAKTSVGPIPSSVASNGSFLRIAIDAERARPWRFQVALRGAPVLLCASA